MTHDRPKYMPDVARVLRENEPAAFAERERKALAKLREEGLIDRSTPEPAARVSAPSPWAAKGEGEGAAIDKAALPSAMAPAATSAEEPPVPKRAAAAEPGKASKQPWKVVAGLAGFVVAVALVSMTALVGQMRDAARKAAASVTVVPSVAPVPSATEVPSVTAMVMPSALPVPSATAAPGAGADAGAHKPTGAREPPPSADDPYAEPSAVPAKSKQPPMVF